MSEIIKSMPSNKAWLSNYDKAFLKLTASEWASKESVEDKFIDSSHKISYKQFKELLWFRTNNKVIMSRDSNNG